MRLPNAGAMKKTNPIDTRWANDGNWGSLRVQDAAVYLDVSLVRLVGHFGAQNTHHRTPEQNKHRRDTTAWYSTVLYYVKLNRQSTVVRGEWYDDHAKSDQTGALRSGRCCTPLFNLHSGVNTDCSARATACVHSFPQCIKMRGQIAWRTWFFGRSVVKCKNGIRRAHSLSGYADG